jgi:radical SAM protein with 4Fe4S-binding SPASM domain
MSALRLISWNLTRRCNLACDHCYLDAVQRDQAADGELSGDEAQRVMRDIAVAAPGAMVVLTGGEPLLRPDLENLVRAAADHGLLPVIGSNGILLDDERAEALKAAGAAGVGVSVDSAGPDFHDRLRGRKGAWIGALRGIAAARAAGLPVLLQATLFEDNRREIVRLADLAVDLEATALNFFFLVCTGRGARQTDLSPAAYEEALHEIMALEMSYPELLVRVRCAPYARRLRGLHVGEGQGAFADWSSACLAGRSYLRIAPDGTVTPCPYIPAGLGNIRKRSLGTIFDNAPELRRLRDETPGGKCGRCDFRLSCGGCRARALATVGDLMAEDSKCAYEPPSDAVPETVAVTAGVAVHWTAEAERALERVPAFVRERVRRRLEEKAMAQGLAEITPRFMFENRPPWLVRGGRSPGFPGSAPPERP